MVIKRTTKRVGRGRRERKREKQKGVITYLGYEQVKEVITRIYFTHVVFNPDNSRLIVSKGD